MTNPSEQVVVPKRTEAHTRYRNQAGIIVPGVTTVLGVVTDYQSKSNLISWANRLGLEGKLSSEVRDEAGDAGKLVHAMIMADLRGQHYDEAEEEFGKTVRDMAANAFLSYLAWKQHHPNLKPIIIETPLVSEEVQAGGCEDLLAFLDDEATLLDWKSGFISKNVYIQTCTYRQFAIENGYPAAKRIIVLSIPRTEDETYHEYHWTEFENGWETFKLARQIYARLGKIKL